jgi:hypothetical protein
MVLTWPTISSIDQACQVPIFRLPPLPVQSRHEWSVPMTDKPDGKRWGWWVKAACAFALLCALYILSIGPATWLILKVDPDLDQWPTTVGSWIYWPVLPTCELTGTERVYLRYLNFFVRHSAIDAGLKDYEDIDAKKHPAASTAPLTH